MAYIDWNDSYSVGVAQLDNQHKQLISLINRIYDAMKDGKANDVLSPILGRLVEYTNVHFSTEEKYFERFGYPGASLHKTEHRDFAARAASFKEDFDSGRVMISMQVLHFLKDWLMNHIQGTDRKYTDFFNQHGLR